MASLYNIEQELVELFDTLESQEGEVTEEQYATLKIKQDELAAKLENYVHAIKQWEGDSDVCKNEKKRINDIQNKYKTRIDKLKTAMIDAVNQFGDITKKGVPFVELPTMRLSVKNTTTAIVDENRTDAFIQCFGKVVSDAVTSGALYTGEDVDWFGVLEAINANAVAEYGEKFERFTFDDLAAVEIEFKTTLTPRQLFMNHPDILKEFGHHPIETNMEDATSKTKIKELLTAMDAIGEDNRYITVGYPSISQSLLIK